MPGNITGSGIPHGPPPVFSSISAMALHRNRPCPLAAEFTASSHPKLAAFVPCACALYIRSSQPVFHIVTYSQLSEHLTLKPAVQLGHAVQAPAFLFHIKDGRASVASSVEGSREARCSYLAASGACLHRYSAP